MSSYPQIQPGGQSFKDHAHRAAELIDVQDIPPLPEVALKVLEYANSATISTEEISRIIIRDQGLTGQILKTANSAFFGLKRQIGTIRHAAVILGTKRLRSVVVTASLSQAYPRTSMGRHLWEHSLVVGLIASEIAKIHRVSDSEMVFVAGIMHDVGKSILSSQYPNQYQSVIDRISAEGVSCVEAERHCLGTDHTHVGAFVSNFWHLPEFLRDAIQNHHNTWGAEVEPEVTSLIYLADRVAQSIGIGLVKDVDLDIRKIVSEVELEVDVGILEAIREGIKKRFETERESFGLPKF